MSIDIDDCYSVLGVRCDATPDEVKQAYRNLVREWHPDRLAHDSRRQKLAEEKLKEINVAYERLRTFTPPTSASTERPARARRNSAGYSAYSTKSAGWHRATASGTGRDTEADAESLFSRAWTHYEEGRALFERGEYTDAVSNLTQAVCLKPNVGDAYFLLGRAYTELKMPAKAASAFKHVLRFDPEREAARDGLARSYLAMGAPKDAVWTCSQALKRNPGSVAARVTLGAAYRKLGQLAQSLEALTGALEAEPESAEGRYELGETYVAMGQKETARQIYSTLKSSHPDLAVQLLLSIVGSA